MKHVLREPHTVEAWLVHLADLAEYRLWAHSNEDAVPSDQPSALGQTGTELLPDSQLAQGLIL